VKKYLIKVSKNSREPAFKFVFFCVVTPYSVVVRYRCFFRVQMKGARSSKTLVSYHTITRRLNPKDHVLNVNPSENLKSFIIQTKTNTYIIYIIQ